MEKDQTEGPGRKNGDENRATGFQATESIFQTYFERALIGMAITSPDKGWLRVNDALCKLLGRSFAELQQTTWADLTHPDDLEADVRRFERLLANETDGYTLEKRFVRKDGRAVPVLLSVTGIRKPDGSIDYVLAQLQDLSSQKNFEQEARQGETNLATTLEELSVSNREIRIRNRIAEVFLTAKGDDLYAAVLDIVLEAMESRYGVFGYINAKGDLVVPTMTRHIWDQCRVSDKAIVFPCTEWGDSIWPSALRQKKVLFSNQRSLRTPEGHIPVDCNVAAPIVYQDRVIGLIQVANKDTGYLDRDIQLLERLADAIAPVLNGLLLHEQEETRRKKAEEALAVDRNRLLTLLDSIEDVIYVADPVTFELLHVNEAFKANWGDGVIGRKCFEVLQERDAPCPFCTNDKIFGEFSGQTYFWEFRNEANKLWYRCADKAIQWIDGRMVRFELASDITGLKQLEEALRESNDNLSRSNRELEQFAYVASHDLQEPLRMVASYTELLSERYAEKLDEKADKYIAYAVDGARRMQNLINDLLLLSRINTRGKPFAPVPINDLLDKVLHGLSGLIRETGADVQVPPLPVVMGDGGQLFQLFQNLVGNAIKFHGDRSPRVEVSAAEQGDQLVFSVKDNGVGIEPAFFERIFVIFQRLHQRGEYPGTGIGLAIAKKIVERHGGNIWVESQPDQGSVFYFTLPGHTGEEEESE